MRPLKLIVGLGNPSPEYDHTRHNVGALWVRELARRFAIPLKAETKFKGELGRGDITGHDVRLLLPSTYMNNSGEAVSAVANFFKIEVDEILVAYDEMAFEPGVVRLKQGGGDNGHNGLKSVRRQCGGNGNYHRLRIGVGHPGDRQLVTPYLTQHKTPADQMAAIEAAGHFAEADLGLVISGDMQAAMNRLHGPGDTPEATD